MGWQHYNVMKYYIIVILMLCPGRNILCKTNVSPLPANIDLVRKKNYNDSDDLI
jgi:hypothetical protein